MSKPLSYSYFQKQYMQRIAAGELFIQEPESPAVDMFIAELNKCPQGDADFSVYKFDDIEWGDFLGDIFSSDENLCRTDTGFEYRAIDEGSCTECLRTFIGKIKKVETKLALLKFFMSDDFRQKVFSNGYSAYIFSADMIQLQCAKLLGEINRSLHGEVAPDLANLPDDYGDEIDDTDGPCVMEIYEIPKKRFAAADYPDDEHQQALNLLKQGNMLQALLDDVEATFDIVKDFYENVKPEQEGRLLFKPELCAPEEVTIYKFHRSLIDKYETIDAQGAPASNSDYSFFKSNYHTLLRYKEQCDISISPQLWDKQAEIYIRQAYFLSHEMRKHGYDTQEAYTMYHLFKMGYESPLCHDSGKYAEKFLHLACLIQDEYRIAEDARNRAKGYGIDLGEMPGDCPCLREMYATAMSRKAKSDTVLWLSAQLTMATDSFEKRIKWLTNIRDHEADELSQFDIPAAPIATIKSVSHLLIRYYTRIQQVIQSDTDASAYYHSCAPEDRHFAEISILFSTITAREMFAIGQSLSSGNATLRNVPTFQAIMEYPNYLDMLLSSSVGDCMRYLLATCEFREMYLKTLPYSEEVERSINHFLAEFFDIYTSMRKEQVLEELSRKKFSYKKPTEADCLRFILSESQSYVDKFQVETSTDASVIELCKLYIEYLTEVLSPSPSESVEQPVVPVMTENNESSPGPTLFNVNDRTPIVACEQAFRDIIRSAPKRGKQAVLRDLHSVEYDFYFNCSAFTHDELAKVLNDMQKKFKFTKQDIDLYYHKRAKKS